VKRDKINVRAMNKEMTSISEVDGLGQVFYQFIQSRTKKGESDGGRSFRKGNEESGKIVKMKIMKTDKNPFLKNE